MPLSIFSPMYAPRFLAQRFLALVMTNRTKQIPELLSKCLFPEISIRFVFHPITPRCLSGSENKGS